MAQTVIAAGLGFAFVFAYPLAAETAARAHGVRSVAAVLLALSLLSIAFGTRRRATAVPGFGQGARAVLSALLLAAAVTGSPLPLRGVLVVLHAALAWIFWRSLRGEGSLIESLVQTLEPNAPGFIRPYCRKVTAVWSAFFVASAAVLAGLAGAGSDDAWQLYSGRIVWVGMAGLFFVEFLVRKTWFRYYFFGGPFDRLWSALFPAENTEAGRRSAEYIRQVKARSRD